MPGAGPQKSCQKFTTVTSSKKNYRSKKLKSIYYTINGNIDKIKNQLKESTHFKNSRGGGCIFTLSLKSAEALTLRGLYLRSTDFSGATLYPV